MAAAPPKRSSSDLRPTQRICRVVYTALRFSGKETEPVQFIEVADYAEIWRVSTVHFIIRPVHYTDQKERSNLLWAAVAEITTLKYIQVDSSAEELQLNVDEKGQSTKYPFIKSIELQRKEDVELHLNSKVVHEIEPDGYRKSPAIVFATQFGGPVPKSPDLGFYSSYTEGTDLRPLSIPIMAFYLYHRDLVKTRKYKKGTTITLGQLHDKETIQDELGLLKYLQENLELPFATDSVKRPGLKAAIDNSLCELPPIICTSNEAISIAVGEEEFCGILPGATADLISPEPPEDLTPYSEWWDQLEGVAPVRLEAQIYRLGSTEINLGFPDKVKITLPINEPSYAFYCMQGPIK